MKFTTDAKEFTKACNEVVSAVGLKSQFPALTGIRLDLKNDILTLTGYDLELGISAQLPVTGEEDGSIVTNAANVFLSVMSKIAGNFEFSTSGNEQIHLKSESAKTVDLIGVSVLNYPSLPIFETSEYTELDGEKLKEGIKSVSHAIDTNNIKPVFSGALFDIKGDVISLVTTNGISLASFEFAVKAKGKENCVVPGKALKAISSLAEKSKSVKFSIEKSHAIFRNNGTTIITRTIAGDFINYERIFSAFDEAAEIEVDAERTKEALELASVFSTERDRAPVVVELTNSGINYSLKSSVGNFETSVPCDGTISFKTAFKPANFLNAIKAAGDGKVKLLGCGAVKPFGIVNDRGYKAAVMPVRL